MPRFLRGQRWLIGIICAMALNSLHAESFRLDITKPYQDSPGVTPASKPEEIANAIQTRANTGARVFLPAGTWNVNRPICLGQSGVELVGAGQDRTILRAADGYRAMPVIMQGHPTAIGQDGSLALISARNFVKLDGILDASAGTRYGLRTCTLQRDVPFPDADDKLAPQTWNNDHPFTPGWMVKGAKPFKGRNRVYVCTAAHRSSAKTEPESADPAWKQHWRRYPSDDAPNATEWAEGNHYAPGDVERVPWSYGYEAYDFICIKAHAADATNRPMSGANRREFWVMRQPFNLHGYADALSAGALDPETKRASDWRGMQQFTLDYAFYSNKKTFGTEQTPLGGIYFGEDKAVWHIRDSNGMLNFGITMDDEKKAGWRIGKTRGLRTGLYRISIQIDFATHRFQAWICEPGEKAFTRVCDDTNAIPEGRHFLKVDTAYVSIAGYTGNPGANVHLATPVNITICGLHESNTLRYADSPELLKRGSNQATDDNFRYFANDKGTMAFLPLTTHPATDEEAQFSGLSIPVQMGDAAGDAAQKGYCFLVGSHGQLGGANQRISDMTIETGPTWGGGIIKCMALDPKFWNLTIRGGPNGKGGYFPAGFDGFGSFGYLFLYTVDMRNVKTSGTHAGIFAPVEIMVMRDITIEPVGRFGFFGAANCTYIDGMTFKDPQTYRCESYFRMKYEIGGGWLSLKNINAPAPAGSEYPSRAAFWIDEIWNMGSRDGCTALSMNQCRISNMGKDAAFLELPKTGMHYAGKSTLTIEASSYSGSQISAFVRSNNPRWYAGILDCDSATPVKSWIDYENPAEWRQDTAYGPRGVVGSKDGTFECIQPHTAAPENAPEGSQGGKFWYRTPPMGLLFFSSLNSGEKPTSQQRFMRNKHVIRMLNEVAPGTPTELNCAESGSPGVWSASAPLPLNQHAPAVTLKATPVPGTGAKFLLIATATDADNDVDRMEFFIDGNSTPFCSLPIDGLPSPCAAATYWTGDRDLHFLTVKVYDKCGQTGVSAKLTLPKTAEE